ncbi:tail fiber protein [Clostridium felsineum]|uniref:tail fiber protein n=1 Tax=Clostridium felsineum TaxID=36839 RepID=UPI0009C4719B|nr:tail fiber protein [Clostridium felsineum]URZ18783.1 hypothetical protein CLFE_048710 [Clostridium felsineum DSM 794]
MSTEVDQIQFKRGNLNDLNTLLDGEPAVIEDKQNGSLYFGTKNGNRRTLNEQDLSDINGNINNVVNTATTAMNNSGIALSNSNQALDKSNQALSTVDTANTNASQAVTTADQALNTANTVNNKMDANDVWVNYDDNTTYYNYNKVVDMGSSYICLVDNVKGQAPHLDSTNTYWRLIASKGKDGAGTGDMSTSTYDINNNGIVDNSERLGGQLPNYYVSKATKLGINNLITNGDFSRGVIPNSSTNPENWGLWGGSSIFSGQGQTNYNLPNTIYLTHGTSPSGITSNNLNLKPNTTYTIAFSYGTEGNINYNYNAIDFYDTNGNQISSPNTVFNYDLSKADTIQSFTFTTPSSFARSVFDSNASSISPDGAFLTRLGNVMLVEGDYIPSDYSKSFGDLSQIFAPNGYGLGTSGVRLTKGTDLKTIYANGWYDVEAGADVGGLGWAKLLVICSGDTNYITQLLFSMTDSTNQMWIRQKTSGIWSNWQEIARLDGVMPRFQNRQAIGNMNNLTSAGIYALGGITTNAPTNGGSSQWGTVIVTVSGDVVSQLVLGYEDDIYYRSYSQGVGWRNWISIKDSSAYAPSGYGLGTYATDITGQDLNNYKVTGFYRGRNCINAPNNSDWFYIQTIGHDGMSWAQQIAWDFYGDVMCTRRLANGTWQNWIMVQNNNDAGKIDFFSTTTIPDGYLKADGSSVNRTTYDKLFTAIGTYYGSGDGSTTFNIPDLRGLVPRGLDLGRGIDVDRTLGSYQADQSQTHHHTQTGKFTTQTYENGNGYKYVAGESVADDVIYTGNNESVNSSETRMKNMALIACIKY